MIVRTDLAFDGHIENKAAFVHMRTRVFRQIKPAVFVRLNIQRRVIYIVVVDKKIIAGIGQPTEFGICETLDSGVLCGKGEGLV